MQQSISINVKGKVQGVFYRQSTKETAIQIGITGEVKNLPDGTVDIIATGSKEQLEKLISWCRKGPPKAVVTDISVKEIQLKEFLFFRIAH